MWKSGKEFNWVKKITVLLMVLFMMIGLGGCSSKEDITEDVMEDTEEDITEDTEKNTMEYTMGELAPLLKKANSLRNSESDYLTRKELNEEWDSIREDADEEAGLPNGKKIIVRGYFSREGGSKLFTSGAFDLTEKGNKDYTSSLLCRFTAIKDSGMSLEEYDSYIDISEYDSNTLLIVEGTYRGGFLVEVDILNK